MEYILNIFGFTVLSNREYEQLNAAREEFNAFFELTEKAIGLKGITRAQFKQDLFVLLETGFKKNGYFVEFGATNGVDYSNTYVLEKHYDWKGILVEPAVIWHSPLHNNRTAIIETCCLWSESGKTVELIVPDDASLSTARPYKDFDMNADSRRDGFAYPVKTISLFDLLEKYNAPKYIDYLSIDTEGSEYEILKHFDFDAHDISIITCEHNYNRNRQLIYELLSSNGYRRVFTYLSKFDDWYIKIR